MIITPSPKVYHFHSSHQKSIMMRKIVVYTVIGLLTIAGIFVWQRELGKINSVAAKEITETQEQFYLDQKNELIKSNKNAFELEATGKKMLDKNYLEMALVYFETATQKDQNYRDAAFYLGYTYLKLAETSPNYLDKKAVKKFSNLAMNKSLESFLKAKDLDPLYSPTYEFLSYIYNKKGDAENSQLCYNKFKSFSQND